MKENIVVYETLRNTIVSCEDKIRNATINMYIVYFTILSFGFKYNWLFLVSFVVLVVFQAMINADQLAITRASMYIRVFFEEVQDDIHWETINADPKHLLTYQRRSRDIGWYINKHGSSVLAIISYFSLLSTLIQKCDYNLKCILTDSLLDILFATIMCLLVVYVNKRNFLDSKEKDIIRESIKSFYDECSKNYQKVTRLYLTQRVKGS